MSKALRAYNASISNSPVTTKVDDSQVENNTGGFVFEVTPKSRLERFLILGVDGGTYYVTENDLTKQNVDFIVKMIKGDASSVLDLVEDISTSGRAYRNNAALFVLALVLNHGDNDSKNRAVALTPQIARTATHLYDLSQYLENLGGWGRAKRRAVAGWFTSKTPDQLAYQAVKYRSRNGWTLRDAMRLSHPVGVDQAAGNFILGKEPIFGGPEILAGFHEMQRASDVNDVMFTLTQFPNLPWETIPTQFLKSPEVWKTLFYNGQLKGQALVRNVVRLSRIGAFTDIQFAGDYAKALNDEDMIRKTRLHPVQFLLAYITYNEGQIDRAARGDVTRKKDWSTNAKVLAALQNGFNLAFKFAEPSGKRFRIGVDVSGSMSWTAAIGADLSAAQGSAVMALALAKLEDNVEILGFANTLRDLGISEADSFSEVNRKVQHHNFGSTNPSLLISDAQNRRVAVDTFVVITDNEVNSGTHPSRTLAKYRDAMGIDAKLIVMGMTSTGFTIADPSDRGMLDVVGFDANVPKIVTDFAAGRV